MTSIVASFPQGRLRRNRQDRWCRELVAENSLSVNDLIWPVFVREGTIPRTIEAMPDVFRHSLDELVSACQKAYALGIKAVALFPCVLPDVKCAEGKEALNPDNLMCRAIRLLKNTLPDLGVIIDVALDPYTSHGHDGLLKNGEIDNDATVAILEKMAVILAQAGVDVVAPSDMMDGRIGAIRRALDETGYQNVRILAYSAKYASAFYGPFREALGSNACLGKSDKKTYQMNPANGREALREGAQDLLEGADMLMVKPGLPYLDVIYRLSEAFSLPLFAYQVSGEYSMLKAAAEKGWIDYEKALLESLICFKRAGATGIISYAAVEVAQLLREG